MEGLEFRRHRRLRSSPAMRGLVRETELTPSHLVAPLFVEEGLDGRAPIEAMPGQSRLGLAALVEEARELRSAGVPAVLLFGIPSAKDEQGSGAYDDQGVVQEAIQRLKDAVPEMLVIGDVCLCEYTSHGHLRPAGRERGRRQRREPAAAGGHGGQSGGRGLRHHRAERHDGWARGRHPRDARRLGAHRHRHSLVRGQVRERVLRAVPRGGRQRARPSATGTGIRWTRRTRAWPATKC